MSKPVTKKVGLTDLKARLSEHMRQVKDGDVLIVTQNEIPVAKLVPYEITPIEITKGEGVKLQPARRRFELMYNSSPVKLSEVKKKASEILLEMRKERF